MRSNITVRVPQNEDFSYSLYARGLMTGVPVYNEDESELIFNFNGTSAVVLFYYFADFKRAYVVTSWESEKDGEKVQLPGVDQPLCVICTFLGSKIRILDRFIKHFSKDDEYLLFRFPVLFWYRFTTMIQCRMGKISNVTNLVNRFSGV